MEDLQRAGQESAEKSDEAKLVVREDGSKMMRVRKRKRRSDQPRKEEFKKRRKQKFLLIIGCVLLLFLCVLGAVVGLAYYNSKSFHEKVQASLAESTGAEVELGLLSVRPDNAEIDEVNLKWTVGKGAIDFLKLNRIQANYGVKSLFGGTWGGTSLQASTGVLTLREPEELKFGGGDSALDFDFSYYRCNSLDVHLGSLKKQAVLTGTDATLKIQDVGMSRISLSGGKLHYPGFEDLSVENGVMIFGDTSGDLIARLISEEERGYLSLEGKIPYKGIESIYMTGKAEGFPLMRFLSDDTKRFFDGVIDSEKLLIQLDPDDRDAMGVEGKFTADHFQIRDFQFLSELTVLLGRKWYDNPRFTKTATGKILRKGNRLELTNLVLEEGSSLKITGNIAFSEDGEMSGTLKIGIPLSISNMIRGKVPEGLFSQPMEGYVWADVNLGGTAISVSDDFGARVGAIERTRRVVDPSPAPSPKEDLEKSFQELTE